MQDKLRIYVNAGADAAARNGTSERSTRELPSFDQELQTHSMEMEISFPSSSPAAHLPPPPKAAFSRYTRELFVFIDRTTTTKRKDFVSNPRENNKKKIAMRKKK